MQHPLNERLREMRGDHQPLDHQVIFSINQDEKREEAWMYVNGKPCILLSSLHFSVANSDPHVAASWRGLMLMGGESSWRQFCKDTGRTP